MTFLVFLERIAQLFLSISNALRDDIHAELKNKTKFSSENLIKLGEFSSMKLREKSMNFLTFF